MAQITIAALYSLFSDLKYDIKYVHFMWVSLSSSGVRDPPMGRASWLDRQKHAANAR